MDEIKKNLEGEKTDSLEGTSPSSEGSVQLSSTPVPTEEDIKEADSLSVDNAGTESDTLPETENVASTVEEPVTEETVTEEAVTEMPATETPAIEQPVTEQPTPEQPSTENPITEKMFTQSQVNDLVGKTRMETREQTYRAVYGRYGVNDESEMDEIVGNAQRYETIHDEYEGAKKSWKEAELARDNELRGIKEQVALLESGIDKNRFDDAKAIIKSKGLEVTVETINNELATHPEWKGTKQEEVNPNFRPSPNAEPQTKPTTSESTINVLGNEGSPDTGGMSEEEYAMKRLYKL